MPDKKGKADSEKNKPAASNDQLGENAGEGRIAKENTKGGKCR